MDIVKFSKSIEDVVKNRELFKIAEPLKRKYEILSSKEIENKIKEFDKKGRFLKIGFIGRVKAGKSSLLNALIFDGENVLPKAATPMTAALTILQYGDKIKADIEFFSEKDIKNFEELYYEYEKKLQLLIEKEYKKLKDLVKSPKKLLNADVTEVFSEKERKKKAEKRAKRKLKEDKILTAAHELYEQIRNSSLKIKDLKKVNTIEADNIEELNKKLLDFVGANGKYTPFTKSVTLSIPNENLKDIQIIDTPGVNDPVISREERTRKLLKDCDVVFIVSPAGQFLSSEDLDLMDRVYSKEGIKHMHIVASQVDNQLYGSEKEEAKGNLLRALKNIEDKLTLQQREIIKNLQSLYPDGGNSFETLLKNKVILSSGVCYSLFKNFNNKEKWDSNMKHVWDNLTFHYPDFFADEITATENLKKLANIETIKKLIKNIQYQKENILAAKKEDFIKAKYNNLIEYKKALINEIYKTIKKISTTDINELRKQIEYIRTFEKAKMAVNNEYYELIERLDIEMREILFEKLKEKTNKAIKNIDNAINSETKTWKEGFFRKEKSKTYNTITTKIVWHTLENFSSDLEEFIKTILRKYQSEWKEKANKKLLTALRGNVVNESMLDVELIRKIIREIIENIEMPQISYSDELSSDLKKTELLKEEEADKYIQKAYSFVSDLRNKVKNDVENYINNLAKKMKQKDIGTEIFGEYENTLKQLENDIKNQALSLERYNYIKKELEAING